MNQPPLTERLRLSADDQFKAAATIEQMKELIAKQAGQIERMQREIDRLLRRGRDDE